MSTPTPINVHTRRQQDAERLYGPLYPYPLRKDTKPRAVYPQGAQHA